MNCVNLGKLIPGADIKYFQVKALADQRIPNPKNLKTTYDKRQRILTNSLSFCYVKNIIPKTEYFTSEHLLTKPYEKDYFSACPPAVVGQFIF